MEHKNKSLYIVEIEALNLKRLRNDTWQIKNVMRRTAGELVYFVGSIPSDKIKLTTLLRVEPADNEYLQYEVKRAITKGLAQSRE